MTSKEVGPNCESQELGEMLQQAIKVWTQAGEAGEGFLRRSGGKEFADVRRLLTNTAGDFEGRAVPLEKYQVLSFREGRLLIEGRRQGFEIITSDPEAKGVRTLSVFRDLEKWFFGVCTPGLSGNGSLIITVKFSEGQMSQIDFEMELAQKRNLLDAVVREEVKRKGTLIIGLQITHGPPR